MTDMEMIFMNREQTPKHHIRAWAKAYRETPEHRFPSDPHAEFFPVDLEAAADEIDRLEKALEFIIEMNRQHAKDQYGDADKAESWACIRVARDALAAVSSPSGSGK